MTYKKVQITATDWNGYNFQESVDHGFDVTEVEIVGHLIDEDDIKVIVALELFKREKDVRRTIVIPKICITDRKELI